MLRSLRLAYRWIDGQREFYPDHTFVISKYEHEDRWFVGNGELLAEWTIQPSDDVRQFI